MVKMLDPIGAGAKMAKRSVKVKNVTRVKSAPMLKGAKPMKSPFKVKSLL